MIALLLSAALAAPTITNAQIRPTFAGSRMTAAYMSVTSPVADKLVSASCDCAASVEMHQTVVENGVARMTGPAPVDLPAGKAVVFAPGGRHLMVMGLKAPIVAGKPVRITLRFEKAGAVTTAFSAGAGSDAKPSPMSDHMGDMDHMGHMGAMDRPH